ncbi:MAG TPA: amidohydrolase family protein [Acidimicrobiales bacterium]|nr:amidohydrolase family protein [Acidimicrobiales bacterium]
MFITDAQIHIWGPDSAERPWPEGGAARTHRVPPLDAEEVIAAMDEAGVDRTVLVPPSWEGDRNDLALDAARDYPDRFAVMGRLNARDSAGVDLARWNEQPGMLGVRLTFHVDTAIADADWLWSEASEASLPVMVFAPGQTPEIGEVARRYPGLRLIIDHCNLATTAGAGEIAAALDPLIPLAELANVAAKVSALPCAIEGEGYPFASLAPHVRRVVDAFGAERCAWGSDLSRLPCPYVDWKRAMAEGLGVLSADEVEWVMGRTIAEWLDWPEPGAPA